VEITKKSWISDEELSEMFSSSYWNDEESEKKKIWGMWETNFNELESKFLKKGLHNQFNIIIEEQDINLDGLNITSLGAGICMLEAMIAHKNDGINKIYNVELSKHRIFDIAPNIFEKYSIPKDKIELCLGSFLDIKLDDNSQDLIIMSQAFHHCSEPDKLLTELKRVLKTDGKIIIVGEHFFGKYQILKRFIKHFPKYLINYNGIRSRSSIIPTWRCLFPIDKVKGDHHYNQNQYTNMFNEAGFEFKRWVFKDYMNQGFCLRLK
tara:strand:+ start:843 stop:1637 length:795 start_codon:yes stop_codon:yes gene_type:complete